MEKSSTMPEAVPLFAGDAWFDPIEAELRERVRQFLEEMIEQEATAALGRGRYRARRDCRLSEWNANAAVAWVVRSGRDRRAARQAVGRRRHDPGVAERGAAALRPDDPASRGTDRLRLPLRHQHQTGEAGARGAVQGRGRQGRGQPGMAQAEDRLGGLDAARPRR